MAAWAGGCQLLLLYFPKLWSAETGDLILILIGFFWIEMRVEILELPASSQGIGSLFLWDYHYNTSFSTVHKAAITKQNSFFIQHQEDLSRMMWVRKVDTSISPQFHMSSWISIDRYCSAVQAPDICGDSSLSLTVSCKLIRADHREQGRWPLISYDQLNSARL